MSMNEATILIWKFSVTAGMNLPQTPYHFITYFHAFLNLLIYLLLNVLFEQGIKVFN